MEFPHDSRRQRQEPLLIDVVKELSELHDARFVLNPCLVELDEHLEIELM